MAQLHLGGVGGEPFLVEADQIATGRTCVLGTSGSGKSYALGVICEELCKNGVPFALVDVEGEYYGLKEKYEVLWVGEEERCDLHWESLDLGELGRHAPSIPPLILDLSETDEPQEKIGGLLSGVYREVSRLRTPYLVILEEADKFVPQVGERLRIFDEIARRGRKRGLGLMLSTQRPSLVDKNVLSQCSNQLIGKLVIKNDLQAVSQFFPGRGLPKELTTLPTGNFYALGGLSPLPVCVKIRVAETSLAGGTPKLMSHPVATSENILAKLRSLRVEEKGRLGLPPLITAEEASLLVKRDRRFVFFGGEETVTKVLMVYRPLVEVEVRIRTGLLRKRFETIFVLLDGVTGRLVRLLDRVRFQEGLERLTGLNTQHMEILKILSPNKKLSLVEIASQMGVSRSLLHRPIRHLEDRRLLSSSKIGRTKTFQRLVDLPKLRLNSVSIVLERIVTSGARVDEIRVREGDVREVFKGLLEGSDVIYFKPFYYPLYHVELALNRKTREVWVDGRTGRNLRSPPQ